MADVDLAKNPMVDAELLKQLRVLVEALPSPSPLPHFAIAHPFGSPVAVQRRTQNHLSCADERER